MPATYDQKCFELAQYFLADESKLMNKAADLAVHIQASVEDWIAWEKTSGEHLSPEK